MKIRFWGVRGSVPSPISSAAIEEKVKEAVRKAKEGLPLEFLDLHTFGGNTTCVEVEVAGRTFVLDMGTGARELGKAHARSLFGRSKSEKRPDLNVTFFQSHVHWDHIQGFPFYAPIFLSQRKFACNLSFFGGKGWEKHLAEVLRGQMSPPEFPLPLQELEAGNIKLHIDTVHEEWERSFSDSSQSPSIDVLARKLCHPQDTFGYRIAAGRKSMAFTTDHEPYAAGIPRGLEELVRGVDVWVTDCQYSLGEYVGELGPQKMGWGHSYPEYIAEVAKAAKPKSVVTTHHDPDSSDARIVELASRVQLLSGIPTMPAYEGLEVDIP